ncbi:MAG: helix-turn-helix transcriptional regulator [Ruminococcus sp.]|jgi:transcriptional regulator with XRE-family HTH domain|nr:helix-turn-helix transcriptional regulator [Ruminococcus sp.]
MNISLANKLSAMRTAAGLSESQAAARADVAVNTLKAWEHGEESPSLAQSITLSKVYGVDISEFAQTADVSDGISLKKGQSVPLEPRHGIQFTPYSEGYLREKIPDRFTDEEIYPQKQTAWNEAPNAYTAGTAYADRAQTNRPNIEVVNERVNAAVTGAAAHIPANVMKTAEKILHKTGEALDRAAVEVQRALNEPAPPPAPKPQAHYVPPKRGTSARDERREQKRLYEQQLRDEKYAREQDKKAKWQSRSLFYKTFPLLMTAAFFLSIPLHLAEIGWMAFLLIPLYYGLINALDERDLKKFPYPVLAVMLYLFPIILTQHDLQNFFATAGLWIFLTIPFYYILIDHIKNKRR